MTANALSPCAFALSPRFLHCHPVLRHGARFLYGTADAGTVAGMTANAFFDLGGWFGLKKTQICIKLCKSSFVISLTFGKIL